MMTNSPTLCGNAREPADCTGTWKHKGRENQHNTKWQRRNRAKKAERTAGAEHHIGEGKSTKPGRQEDEAMREEMATQTRGQQANGGRRRDCSTNPNLTRWDSRHRNRATETIQSRQIPRYMLNQRHRKEDGRRDGDRVNRRAPCI